METPESENVSFSNENYHLVSDTLYEFALSQSETNLQCINAGNDSLTTKATWLIGIQMACLIAYLGYVFQFVTDHKALCLSDLSPIQTPFLSAGLIACCILGFAIFYCTKGLNRITIPANGSNGYNLLPKTFPDEGAEKFQYKMAALNRLIDLKYQIGQATKVNKNLGRLFTKSVSWTVAATISFAAITLILLSLRYF